MSKKKTHYSKAGLVFEELEPRLLLSADPLAVATDANVATVQQLVPDDNEDQTSLFQVDVEQAFSSVRNELVIIDSRAPNYQQLHNDLIKAQQQGRNIHVVVLDAHRDGIEQINEALASHNKLDAVHIVSHGDDGQLQLGATQLNKTTLRDRSADISSWKDTFTDGGDLLIYGCNLAGSAEGKTLVDGLSYLTATDVAASDDLTGNQFLGGDWDLEYNAGDIESDIAFSDDVQQNWQGTLDGAAQAAAEEQQAEAEEQQQEQQTQIQQTEQQAALREEEQAAAKQDEEQQQATLAEEQRQEIVFIDESVHDYQSFIDDLQTNSNGSTTFEIVLLDGENDSIETINEVLSAYNDVDALHIISHGDDGAVKLGNTWLNADNLDQYSDSLTAWGSSLDQNADLLIYGCNLAESSSGEQFVAKLAQLTGTDVATSDDITGHALLGGDWDLEYHVGDVETTVAVSQEAQQSWQAILATATDDFSSGDYTGGSGWAGDWVETNDTPNRINVVDKSGGGDWRLLVRGDSGAQNYWVSRQIDLSSATTATLSYDYELVNHWDADFKVQVRDTDTTWVTLADYSPSGSRSGSESFVLDPTLFDNGLTEIRFFNGKYTDPDYWYIDNVQITHDGVAANTEILYLDGVGDGSDVPTAELKIAAPVDTTLDNFDPARDALNGLLIAKGASGVSETDPNKYQLWRDTNAGASIDGQVTLDLWSAVKNFDTTKGASITAYLVASNADGSSVTEIASTTVTRADWDVGNTGSWIEDTFDFGSVTHQLTGSEYLGVKIIVDGTSQGNMWLAYDATTHPSSLSYDAGTNTSPTISSNGGGAAAGINVVENATAVTTVTATDADLDTLSYSIDPASADVGKLSIDPSSGVLTFNTAPDYEVPGDANGDNVYEVTVRVVDGNGGEDTQAISVTVTDVSSNLVVTTTANINDGDVSSAEALNVSKGADGFISLSEAITAANNSTETVTISFNITDPLVNGAHTFVIGAGGLPAITDTVIIDGTTEPDYAGTPIIVLDGSSAGAVDGLTLAAGSNGSTVRGLVINRFGDAGIKLESSDNHNIVGNYIGTDAAGTGDQGNTTYGVEILNSSANQIGGSTAADRNVISGNNADGIVLWGASSTLNVIQGNYIGVDASGNAGLGNSADGIVIGGGANNNTIGGDRTAGEGNVISGQNGAASDGIELDNAGADNNKIYGNYIGTNYDGTAAIANARHGIVIYDEVQGTQIGGTGTGQGNIISGNSEWGILIDGNGNATTTANVIVANTVGLNAAGDSRIDNVSGGIMVFNGASGNTIGGTTVNDRNVISGNQGAGIYVTGTGTDANVIQGNFLGTDITGATSIHNWSNNIDINQGAGNTLVGGSVAGAGNTIAFSGSDGISIWSGTTSGTIVQGNFIGTDATGTLNLGNSNNGITISGDSDSNLVGGTGANEGNLIYHNNDAGIDVRDSGTLNNAILGNSFTGNTELAIDLGADGVTSNDSNDGDSGSSNDLQNFPVLASAETTGSQITINGSMNSTANSYFRIEFFASVSGDATGHGEGQTYLGFANVATDGSGNANINAILGASVADGAVISATATRSDATYTTFTDTSEFAANIIATLPNVLPVAVNDTVNVAEDTPTIIDLVGNDTDADGDTLTVLDFTTPANGTLVNNGDGTVTYTPTNNYNGSDTFDYVVTDSNDGRTHYWNLDGDAEDAIGGSNGTLNGGTTTIAGDFGNGMSFDEVDDHVIIPDVTYNDEFSISLSFKVDDISGSSRQYLYSHGASNTNNSINIFIKESGHTDPGMLRTSFLDSNDPLLANALDIDINALVGDGLWHTYTFTTSLAEGSKVYLDGVLSNSDARGGDSFNPTTDVYLGAREDLESTRFYGGSLDTVQIFDTPLSASDVADLHSGGTSVATVNITVTSVNDDPVAVGESFTTAEGVPYTAQLGLDDLLLNDTDVEGDTLSVNTTPVSGPSNGALVLNADGTFTYTANHNFNGTDAFTYEVLDGNGGTAQATATFTVQPREIRILFSTNADINDSKVPGIDSWETGDILGIGGPNLTFEPAGSDGSVQHYMDLESFAADTEMVINGMHYVSNNITVGGANSVALQHGDILFVSETDETMTSTNSLAITAGDVIVFRPDAADDYSAGTFIHLLDQPGANLTTGITLVESDVLIGDVTLQAGSFLFTQEGSGAENSIYHFSADDAGAGTTTGTVSTLISSLDIGVSDNSFVGLMIVSEDLYLDGATVPAGSIITTLSDKEDSVGGNGIKLNPDELFYLTVTTTTMGSGTTTADATLLFDGGDIGLKGDNKKIRAFTLVENIIAPNIDPVITLSAGSMNYTELDPPTIIDAAASLADPDSTDLDGGLLRVDLDITGTFNDRLAIRHQGTAAGQIGISGTTVTYGGVVIGTWAGGTDGSDPLTVTLNANADVAAVEALMRNVSYENVSNNPSLTQRSARFMLSDGDGGASNIVAKTIVVNGVNSAPVLSGANNLTAIDEDAFSNGGTLVSDLILGQVTDADPSAPEGIAVVSVDNTNGSWEYTTDSGANWTAFGSPSASAAVLLAADADTFVRFVPDPNWNGTVTNGITFHAWDQTTGINGDAVDMNAAANVRDQFDTNAYSNNDGSAVWTSGWTEVNDDGNSSSGNIRIDSGELHIDNQDGGAVEYVYRSADLSDAASATLSFDFNAYGAGSLDRVTVGVSSDGGSTWTTLREGNIVGNVGGFRSINIESFTTLSSDMLFRFGVVTGMDGAGEHINFDNIDISYTGTGIGGSSAISVATASSSITVNPINDVPVATANTVSTTEDTAYSFAASDFSFGDVEGDAIVSATLTNLSLAGGTLSHSGGTVVNSGDTLTAAQLDTLIYTPATNANGSPLASFDFTVNDAGAGVVTAQMDIDVTAVDDVPVAMANTVTTTEDNAYTFSSTDFSFSDAEGDALVSATLTNLSLAGGTLTHSGGTAVTSGDTLTAAQLDTLIYTPSANANGSPLATFDFSVNDAGTGTASAQMDIDVTAVNDIPVASANTVTTTEDNAYNFTAADFTFSDIESDSIVSATITNLSLSGGTLAHSGGTAVNNGDTLTAAQLNTLVYTPAANVSGSPLATFDFTVNDAGAGVVTAQMDIDVTALNDVPVATTNTVTTTEDNVYNFTAADFTFTDIEGDSLVSATITNMSLAGGTLTHSGGTGVNTGDTLTAAQLDTLVYTPTANANGSPLASFDFTVNDAGSGVFSAQMDIDVTAVNDVPVAIANTVTTTEDTTYTFSSVDFSFSDVEGDALVSATITNLSLAGGTLTHSGGTAVNNGDTLSAAQLDALVYTPAANVSGSPLATFDFTVNDAGAGVVTAQMDIDVTAANDVPVATVNTVTTTEDNAYIFTAADFSFTDVEGDALVSATITNLSLAGGTLTHSGGTGVNNGDTLTAAQLDTLLYTAAANANGSPLATFDFSVNDAGTGVVTAQMDIDVSAVNDVPVATANTVTTAEDNAYTFSAADFTFSDIEGDSLVSATIINLSLSGGSLTHSGGTAVNNGDTLTAIQLDTLVYTPTANSTGSPLATFDFTVNDTGAGVVTAQMDIDVVAVNDVPVATSNTVTTTEDNAYNFAASDFTFTDTEGDALVSATITNLSLAGGTLTHSGGTVVNNGDMLTAPQLDTLVYTPAANVSGSPLATFDFTVNDAGAGVVTAQMDIDVTAVNDVPVATVNTVTTTEDNVYNFTAADFSFTDVEGDSLVSATITNMSLAGGALTHSGGTGVNNGDTLTAAQLDTLVYTPAANANGSPLASFDFTVNDAGTGTASAQMDIDVTSVNDIPMASANTVTTTEDNAYNFTAADFTFSDIESDSIVSATIFNQSLSGGTLTHSGGITVNNSDTLTAAQLDTLIYTPTANTTGSPLATFDFIVNDAGVGVVTAQMGIDVTAVNDVPVATANTVTTTEDNAYSFSSSDFTFTDIEGDALVSATITNLLLAGGTLTHSGGTTANNGDTLTAAQLDTLIYTPATNANGSPLATFDFSVSDAGAGVVTAQMDIDVTAVNDVPVAMANTVTTTEDNAYNFTAADFTLSDVEGDSLVSARITNLSLAGGTLTYSGGTAVNSGDTLTAAQLNTLVYTPASNVSGAPLATFDFTVNDASFGVVTAQMDIDVTAVNDIPVATANTITTTEDNAYIFTTADFTFTDVEGDSLVSATITNLSLAGGTLTHSGGIAVNNGDTLTAAQLDTLTYISATNTNGSPLATFDFTVNDAGAGVVTAQMDIDVTAVNDVPVATANTVTTTEDNAYNFTAADFTFTDVEGDSLVSATITNLSLAGGALMHSGGIAVNNGDTLTEAQLNTLVYTPTANANGAALATFDFSVNDAGTGVVTAQMDIDVTAVNDVPVATVNTVTTTEDNAYNFTAADFTFSDIEGDSLVSARITNLSLAGGSLTYSGGIAVNNGDTLSAAQLDTLVYTPTTNMTGSPLATFDFTVNDADVGVITAQMDIDVTAVNDVPVATANTVTTTEDNTYNFTASDFTFTDSEGDALVSATITNLSLVGGTLTHSGGITVNNGDTLTAAQLDTLVYTAIVNANGSPLATFDFSVNDAGAGAVTAQMDIDVTAVNDVPVATANTVITTEDNAYNFTAADFTFSDVEGNALVSATITNLSLVGGTLTHSGGIAVNNGDTLTAAQLDTLVYTPIVNANGAPLASFDFSVNDAGAGVVTAQMDIDVTVVNDIPVASANTVTTTEDNAYNFTAADFSFSDVEGDSLVSATITNVSLAGGTLTHSGGTAVNNGDTLTAAQLNTLIYTPTANTTGSPLATFDFSVNDTGVGVVTAQMDIDVTAVNDVPVAMANTVTTTEDNAYTFTAADFSFTDVEGDDLVSARITNLSLAGGTLTHSGGTAVNSGDTLTAAQLNTLVYTPAANVSGAPLATLDFTVNDASFGVVTAQMDIDVTAVNDVPVATVNTVTTTEDNAYNFTAADFTFSDIEGDSLVSARITNLSLAGGSLMHSGGIAVNNGDTLTAAQLDTLVYTPTANTTGSPLATFDFNVNDAGAGVVTAQMDIDVTAVNDVPVATANTVSTTEDNAYTFAASDFTFTDTEGDALVSATITNLSLAGGSLTHSGGTAVNNGDTLTAVQLDTLVYTPVVDVSGSPLANFDFTVNDAGMGVVTAQMDIDVTAVNDVPVATANTVTTTEDNAYNFSAADFTFTDVEGDSLVSASITNLSLAGGTLTHSGGIAINSGDTLTAAQLNTLVYTPAADANGSPLASFDFTVNDAGAGVVAAQMSINVASQPDIAVIAGVDTGVVTEDVDPDMNNLLEVSGSLTIIDPDGGEAMFNAGVVGGTYGVITLNAAGDWDYAANNTQPAIQGLAAGASLSDTITISSVDGTTHDVVITIMGTNDAPVAGNDVAVVNEGGTVIIDVAATDSDVDSALDLNSISIVGLPASGSIVVNGDGTLTYTHNGSETLNDSFSYTISDVSGAVSNTATVSITVAAVNDAPVAANDAATVAEGNTILIDLAANDSDADNTLDLNSISITGAPANGTLMVNGDGTVSYTHDGTNTASDSFSYTISDISGAISNSATVNISVTAVNDAPTTSGIADVAVNEDAAVTSIDLNAAFDDSDNLDSELSYTIVGNTDIGLFSAAGIDDASGQLTLDYAANMNGSAQIAIRATDPSGQSVDTLFTVTVAPVNDSPVLQANTGVMATAAAPTTISGAELNVSDIDNLNSELVYTVTTLPANGALLLNGVVMAPNDSFTQADLDSNRLVYQAAGTVSADQFGFTVSDSAGGTLANSTFDILVQVGQNNDNDESDNATSSNDGDTEEVSVEEDSTTTDTGAGGANEGAGGYGGGFEPLGGASVPPAPSPVLTIEQPSSFEAEAPRQIASLEEFEIVNEADDYELSTFAAVQMKSMDALWASVDKMKQEMAESAEKMDAVELKVAAAKSSGVVLTAGIVAWAMRSGALLSSLMSTIPLWKGYDPLAILTYKDKNEDDDEKVIDGDTIPTSLEELKKLKKIKEQKEKELDVDSMFGGTAIRE